MSESDWQPIETAPKDGTEILVWEPEPSDPRPCRQYFVAWSVPNGFCRAGDEYNLFCSPTHWQPLPEPPHKPGVEP